MVSVKNQSGQNELNGISNQIKEVYGSEFSAELSDINKAGNNSLWQRIKTKFNLNLINIFQY
ncbi:MAG: hypothetical protein ABJK28_12625 [Algibacter sp.]